MIECGRLSSVAEADLVNWVRGYWTGANLYLGSDDLCLERAATADVPDAAIRVLIEVHCAPIIGKDGVIMMAAFNALKGLPTLPGSFAAACGEIGDLEPLPPLE